MAPQVGRPPTPHEAAERSALDVLSSPDKQLELIEKRSTWVFSTVGVLASAATGFTLLGAASGVFDGAPWMGVLVLVLALGALAAAGANLVVRTKLIHKDDPKARAQLFQQLITRRARLARTAVILLVASIVLAGGTAMAVRIGDHLDGAEASASLEATVGEDGTELAFAVKVEGLETDEVVRVRLTTEDGGTSTVGYDSVARAGSDGEVELTGELATEAGTSATLTVAAGDDELQTLEIDLP